jgi:putative lipase involved disintegration of autophagic bodies
LYFTEINTDGYKLLGVDLTQHNTLEALLKLCGIDFDLPTLLLSECVLTYMTKRWKISKNKTIVSNNPNLLKGRHDRDGMVVGFTTTYAICAYHHWCYEFESRSGRGVQHHVIKFVSDLWQVGGYLRVLRFPPLIKLTATI